MFKKLKIMASGPIISWQIDGRKVEAMTDFIFLGSKINVDTDCSHEIKRHLLLGRKAMTSLDNILQSRDSTLLTKVHIVKTVFSSSHAEMWELDHKEGWMPKNWCFWAVVLKKTLLRVPWTERRSNQSILKEINLNNQWKNCSWSWSSNTLALMWRADSLKKVPDAGKDWKQKEKRTAEDEMVIQHHWLNGHELEHYLGI